LPYNEALYLWKDAKIVLTDSGGLQEETTALRVPCITLRENTESPVTVKLGSNVLAGKTRPSILATYDQVMNGSVQTFSVPPLQDGKATERIWEAIEGLSSSDYASVSATTCRE
jgi:UDP-N-acetylglucosamine 2-epimerase (non-hydrolysing)